MIFFLCLQHETSSFLLFSVQRCGSRIIMNFSSKHKLQRLLALLYGLARAIICHVITWLILLSFNDQTYLLSSVEFLDVNHVITWQIIARAKPYSSASKRCNLCLLEKFIIIREPHRCTLNKRNELVSCCRHRKKSLQRSN